MCQMRFRFISRQQQRRRHTPPLCHALSSTLLGHIQERFTRLQSQQAIRYSPELSRKDAVAVSGHLFRAYCHHAGRAYWTEVPGCHFSYQVVIRIRLYKTKRSPHFLIFLNWTQRVRSQVLRSNRNNRSIDYYSATDFWKVDGSYLSNQCLTWLLIPVRAIRYTR